MAFYNIEKVFREDNKTEQVWFTENECDLSEKEGFERVYNELTSKWYYQSKEENAWNIYLVNIGVKKLSPSEKIDNGKIIPKTLDELLEEKLISQKDFNAIKQNEIKSKLLVIDQKKVRAITDYILTQDKTNLESLESEASLLRIELKKYI